MSDLNQEFTLTDINSVFVVEPNDITISPNPVQLSIFTGSSPVAGGSFGQVQFNNGGQLGGIPNTQFSLGNLTLGNLANIKITGGANAYFLQTDGTGNLVWAQGTANVSGNGTAAGANTQIQISDGTGNFTSAPGFTFDASSNILAAPGNGAFVGNVSASYFIGNGAFLTGLNTSSISNGTSNVIVYNNSNVNISMNGVANVVEFNYLNTTFNSNVTANIVTANIFSGNLYGTANVAVVAGTVTTNAQPNITSLGTLANLNVAGTGNVQQIKEKVNVSASPATGTINYDLLNGAIVFQTANATGNFTLNFRGNSTTTLNSIVNSNESITCTFVNLNSSPAYVPTSITIDGAAVTPRWAGTTGLPPAGTINGRDVYNFNIIKTAANTYTVLATGVGYL